MGQTHSVATEIEIAASPEEVRQTFLDFASYKDWAEWRISLPDNVGHTTQLKEGDYLKVQMPNLSFSPKFEVNSPELFQWIGAVPVIFSGRHHFAFTPSQKTPGGTTFRQFEEFTGVLSFLMAEGWSMRKSTVESWESFNESLKREVTRRAGAGAS